MRRIRRRESRFQLAEIVRRLFWTTIKVSPPYQVSDLLAYSHIPVDGHPFDQYREVATALDQSEL
jgi:hypothetical protein